MAVVKIGVEIDPKTGKAKLVELADGFEKLDKSAKKAKTGVGDALSGSFRLVKDNAGPIFLWVLLLVLLVIASVCTCGIALFVTVPIFSISTAYVYRVTTGGQVAQPV